MCHIPCGPIALRRAVLATVVVATSFLFFPSDSAAQLSLGGAVDLIVEETVDDEGVVRRSIVDYAPRLTINGDLPTVPINLSIALNGRGLNYPPALWNNINNWDNPAIGFQPGFAISALVDSAWRGNAQGIAINGLESLKAIVNDGPTESTLPVGFSVSGTIPALDNLPFDLALGLALSLRWDVELQAGGLVVLNQDTRLQHLLVNPHATLVVQDARTLAATDGIHLNGTVRLEGAYDATYYTFAPSTLTFAGAQSISGTGEIVFATPMAGLYQQYKPDVFNTLNTSGTLTVGPGITIHGNTGVIGNDAHALINYGRISADVAGESITVQGDNWRNYGLLEAKAGAGLVTKGAWLNSGQVLAEPATQVILGGNWHNEGLISGQGGTIYLGSGSYDQISNSGLIDAGPGTVNIAGTLNNESKTLMLTSAHGGNWELWGGKIIGGTVNGATGKPLAISYEGSLVGLTMNGDIQLGHGSLVEVTMNGDIQLGGVDSGFNSGRLTVQNGLTLNGTVAIHGTYNPQFYTFAHSEIFFSGSQTLSGAGEIVFATPMAGLYQQYKPDVFNTLNTSGTLTVGPGITIHGNTGVIGNDAHALINYGRISADVAGESITVQGDNWVNSGTLEAKNGGSLLLNGSWEQRGQVSVYGDSIVSAQDFRQREGNTNLDDGILSLAGGLVLDGGALTGSGHIIGNVVNAALLAPGNSLGSLSVQGDYLQSVSGFLKIELGGYTPGVDADWLKVDGIAWIGGTIEVHLIDGFVPQEGDTFKFLTATRISGHFQDIIVVGTERRWGIAYTDESVSFTVLPVPEPSSLFLAMFGAAISYCVLRRASA